LLFHGEVAAYRLAGGRAGRSESAALPRGPVPGSLNLIFFSSSMTPEVAASRYLPDMKQMKQAVMDIERRWSAANTARGKVA
jgi:IclR family mhp operon transcriptional activator